MYTGGANFVYLQGYYAANDGGGGLLTNIGTCNSQGSLTLTWTGTSNAVSVSPSLTNIAAGYAIQPQTGTTYLPTYDQVTSVSVDGSSITLAVVPTTAGTQTGVTINCENEGTVFNASGSAYARNSNFSQYEWGAFDHGTTDDLAPALQQWLNAPQAHLAQPGTVTIQSPVTCPNGGAIQGPPTTAVAEDPSVLPAFIIYGTKGFVGNAMFIIPNGGSCGIHSVGLIASGANNANTYDVVEAMGKSTVIDQHSYLANGYYNVNAASGQGATVGAADFQAYDSSFNNSLASNLRISSPNTKVTRNSIAGSGSVAASAPQTFSMRTTTTSSSASTISFSNVAPITVGLTVTGVNVPSGTYVKSVSSGSITLSNNAGFATNQNVVFSMPIELLPSSASGFPSATINFSSTGSVVRGMTVTGRGVTTSPPTYVVSVTSTVVTLNQGATISSTTSPITFSLPSDSSNIRFSGSEGVFADNIIQQGGGWGINLGSAKSVRVGTNFFDNNGRNISGTGAILVNNAYHVTICNNTFSQSGLATELDPTNLIVSTTNIPPLAAHISFGGLDDTISLCGNVFIPDQSSGSNNLNSTPESSILTYPDFTYDVPGGGTFSNIRIDDNTAPQQVALMTPNAAAALAGFMRGQPVPGAISGLTLVNSGGSTVNILPGSVTDSTGTATITIPASGCSVNLATGGAQGLDTGTGTVLAQHTYFFFVVSGPGGTNPTCIASNGTTPNFTSIGAYAISGTGVTPQAGSSGSVNAAFPSNTVYNFTPQPLPAAPENPLAGVLPGDQVTSSTSNVLYAGTTVSAVSNFKAPSLGAVLTASSSTVNLTSYPAGLMKGMQVAGSGVPPGTTIANPVPTLTACTSGCTLTLSNGTSSGISSSVLSFSGGSTITLNQNAQTATIFNSPASLTIYPVRYRLIGALYTIPTSTDLVAFQQEGNTFYLRNSAIDFSSSPQTGQCSTATSASSTTCKLSVPCGLSSCSNNTVKVEAFGRFMAGGNVGSSGVPVLASSPDQAAQVAAQFGSGSIGMSTQIKAGDTAFPFRLFTDTNGAISVQAASASGVQNEVTDGWVFPR